MEISITQWALNSYLELKNNRVFSNEEYKYILRPDIEKLANFPNDPKFSQNKFWSIAQDQSGKMIANGYNRLTIGIFDQQCVLCEAYVKQNEKQEWRQLAKFKTYLQLIRQNNFTICGRLLCKRNQTLDKIG